MVNCRLDVLSNGAQVSNGFGVMGISVAMYRSNVGRRLCAVLGAACLTGMVPAAALADLKLCNATPGRVGVALGYQDKKGWATEGWWNIPSQTCENLLKGTLPSRYLYVHAVDYERGGEWSGTHYMCTKDSSFTIRDTKNCEERGFKRKGFYEIDTGFIFNASAYRNDNIGICKIDLSACFR